RLAGQTAMAVAMAGAVDGWHSAHKPNSLGYVESSGIPVQTCPPAGQPPSQDPGGLQPALPTVAQQHQRERVQQAEGGGLPEEVHRQRGKAPGLQDWYQTGDHDITSNDDRDQPPRDDPS